MLQLYFKVSTYVQQAYMAYNSQVKIIHYSQSLLIWYHHKQDVYLLEMGEHTKLIWLQLLNSHCATKSLFTSLQMSTVHFK